MPIYAQSIEVDILKEEIKSNKLELERLDILEVERQTTLTEHESTLITLKNFLTNLKSQAGDSWDAVKQLTNAKEDIESMEKTIILFKQELEDIFSKKSMIEELILNSTNQILHNQKVLDRKKVFDDLNLTKLVGVNLSKSCEIMIKNNITNNCPTY